MTKEFKRKKPIKKTFIEWLSLIGKLPEYTNFTSFYDSPNNILHLKYIGK